MTGTFVYANSQLVTRNQLRSIRPPAATATWRPIDQFKQYSDVTQPLPILDQILPNARVEASDDVRIASAGQRNVHDATAEREDGLSLGSGIAERCLVRCVVHGAERTAAQGDRGGTAAVIAGGSDHD